MWCATIGDWHTDWMEDVAPDDDRPSVCSLPIRQIPTTGTLRYMDTEGERVEHPAPARTCGDGTRDGRAFAPTADGGCVDIRAELTPGARPSGLTIHGRNPEESQAFEVLLRHAFRASGFQLPAGGTVITLSQHVESLASLQLALACAVLAVDEQIARERLATHALHGELCPDSSLRLNGDIDHLADAAGRGAASALLAPAAMAFCGPPLQPVASLRDVTAILGRAPLPTCCPACGSIPRVLGGEELVELRRRARAGAAAHEACCDDEPGWRCANVECTHYACYLSAPLSAAGR